VLEVFCRGLIFGFADDGGGHLKNGGHYERNHVRALLVKEYNLE
jgi:hypothetical protein